MSVYTLALSGDVAESRCGPEERLQIAAEVMTAIGETDPQALVLLPAGYAVATSEKRRDEWAQGMAAASRAAGVAVVLGIDVAEHEKWGVEGCPRSYGFASDRGRQLLWGITPTGRASSLVDRTVTFDAARVTVLFARELLTGRALSTVDAAQPDLVIVLGHGPPTKKWLPPLGEMDALAPTLVVHQALEVHRPVALPAPRGWRPAESTGPICIVAYRREADGAAARVVGN